MFVCSLQSFTWLSIFMQISCTLVFKQVDRSGLCVVLHVHVLASVCNSCRLQNTDFHSPSLVFPAVWEAWNDLSLQGVRGHVHRVLMPWASWCICAYVQTVLCMETSSRKCVQSAEWKAIFHALYEWLVVSATKLALELRTAPGKSQCHQCDCHVPPFFGTVLYKAEHKFADRSSIWAFGFSAAGVFR